jgi:hypothetical protein
MYREIRSSFIIKGIGIVPVIRPAALGGGRIVPMLIPEEQDVACSSTRVPT